ncbi:MAG: hypothetical protein E4H27_10035 [Anaerolineales bacterium]|nr:MAG: hypothetical protein E4H27_10035 [Anaerolineales bacterium]
MQKVPGDLWGACNTIEEIYQNNIRYFADSVAFDWSDDLPYLEPWIGTGVYANAYGCDYLWRDDNAPDVHYRYHHIEEVRDLPYPDYHQSPVMQMVLECIDVLKERTFGQLPICLTDTQSPFDTATLILDAAEFFTACYTHRDIVLDFMDKITNLIIEFSQVQAERIGDTLWTKPGHIMPASPSYRGISISDDNLAVSSPKINEIISLPSNQKIADAFNGVAIHSCGKWAHTMAKLKDMQNVIMVDCAVSREVDPTPNAPASVREAMKGSGIITKVRVGGDMPNVMRILDALFDPSLKLIVEINYSATDAERNYKLVRDKLSALYGV